LRKGDDHLFIGHILFLKAIKLYWTRLLILLKDFEVACFCLHIYCVKFTSITCCINPCFHICLSFVCVR
jgi:hypothetical protein